MKFWEQIAPLLPEEGALADRAASRPMERTLSTGC
jgi:hypothetical protein